MVKKIILRVSSRSHIPDNEREEDKFYFELRTGDLARETYIGKKVLVNNEGTLVSNRDILKDVEEIEAISPNMELNMAMLPHIYEDIVWDKYEV